MSSILLFFFFNDPAPTEIYTLSLHDALPISGLRHHLSTVPPKRKTPSWSRRGVRQNSSGVLFHQDRKSTRLNSSHTVISYAVFCLKKKKKQQEINTYHDDREEVHQD